MADNIKDEEILSSQVNILKAKDSTQLELLEEQIKQDSQLLLKKRIYTIAKFDKKISTIIEYMKNGFIILFQTCIALIKPKTYIHLLFISSYYAIHHVFEIMYESDKYKPIIQKLNDYLSLTTIYKILLVAHFIVYMPMILINIAYFSELADKFNIIKRQSYLFIKILNNTISFDDLRQKRNTYNKINHLLF